MRGMNGIEQFVFGSFGIFIFIFLAVAVILWIFMPFSVFGIKDRIGELESKADASLQQVKEINEALQRIDAGIRVLIEQGKLGLQKGGRAKQPLPADEDAMKDNPFLPGK